MTVQELIDELMRVADKTIEVEINDRVGGSYLLEKVMYYNKTGDRLRVTTAKESEYVELT